MKQEGEPRCNKLFNRAVCTILLAVCVRGEESLRQMLFKGFRTVLDQPGKALQPIRYRAHFRWAGIFTAPMRAVMSR